MSLDSRLPRLQPSGVIVAADGSPTLILLHPSDDVAIVGTDVASGTPLSGSGVTVVASGAIPSGHKVALRTIAVGDAVRKYGEVIGHATQQISPGDHVHEHNLGYRPVEATYVLPEARPAPERPVADRTFQGFRRRNGKVGTRNVVGLLTTVNCSASVSRFIAAEVEKRGLLRDYPTIDGIVALTHTSGCAMPTQGEGFEILRRTILGYANHPNFGGVLMLSLGCETNELQGLMDDPRLDIAVPNRALVIQEQGGTRETVNAGIRAIEELLPEIADVQREAIPASELIVAMECGGSDAYSGIAANPVVGRAADRVVWQGGTAAYGETPEIYGAEHLVAARARDPEVARRLFDRIAWWNEYASANSGSMDSNPAPGNKAGGITTILEKSLGAIAKGGSTDLVDVVEYAERMQGPGLVFMDTPGYDPVSVTGLVAGGAQIVCFTTGRGSVFGCSPVPSIKVASNSPMFERMREDMDVNAGRVVDGTATVEEVGDELFELILEVASGRQPVSEELGFGQDEFAPWPLGAVM
jgi:arabinonate dehydratase